MFGVIRAGQDVHLEGENWGGGVWVKEAQRPRRSEQRGDMIEENGCLSNVGMRIDAIKHA